MESKGGLVPTHLVKDDGDVMAFGRERLGERMHPRTLHHVRGAGRGAARSLVVVHGPRVQGLHEADAERREGRGTVVDGVRAITAKMAV